MIQKLIAIIMSKQTQEEIVERIRGNPKTSLVALAVGSGFGATAWLVSGGYVIAGGLVAGATSLVAVAALLLAGDEP